MVQIEVREINISEFLKWVREHSDDQKGNQGSFVVSCFIAAGSNYFQREDRRGNNESARKLMKETGNSHLSKNMKSSFPSPISPKLADFFSKINEEQLRMALNEKGLSMSTKANKSAYGKALSDQFDLFVRNKTTDVKDIIVDKYLEYLKADNVTYADQEMSDSGETLEDILEGRYPDDKMRIIKSRFQHEFKCHETITHYWRLKNIGKIPWVNRKLIMENQGSTRPRAIQPGIDIPETRPGKETGALSVEIDGRGFEGEFECRWIMVDQDGVNCFPEAARLSFKVITKFIIN